MSIILGFIGLMCWLVLLAAALTGSAPLWMPFAPLMALLVLAAIGCLIDAVQRAFQR